MNAKLSDLIIVNGDGQGTVLKIFSKAMYRGDSIGGEVFP